MFQPVRLGPGAPRPATRRLGSLVAGLVATGFGCALVLLLTTKTSKGASATTLGAIIFALTAVWLFRTRKVHLALAVAIAYLGLLDGVLRLESGSSMLTMARDVAFYSVAIGMLVRAAPNMRQWQWPPLTAWVLGWTAIVLVQLLNPSSGPTLHRIVSLRQDLEFVPLFFIGYVVVRSRARLRGLIMLLLVIGGINGAVGLYQSGLSPDQLASWGPGYYSMIHGTNGSAPTTAVGADGKQIVRPPALGGDMGFAGAIGMIALPGGLALLLRRRRSLQERAVIGTLVVFTTLGVLTSQSRASIISAVVGLLAFGAVLAASRDGRRVVTGMAVVGAIVALAVSMLSGGALSRYSSIAPSHLANTVSSSRADTFSLIPTYITAFPFGAGIGSSGPAWKQYGAADNTISGESQITFLIGEVGIPGLLLFVLFQARVLGGAVRRVRKIEDSEIRLLLAALIAALFALVANWYVGINTVSPPNAPFMWGAIGVIAFWLLRGRNGPVPPPEPEPAAAAL
jgi:hypothetical protein